MTTRNVHVCDYCNKETDGGSLGNPPKGWLALRAEVRGAVTVDIIGDFCSPTCLRSAFSVSRFPGEDRPAPRANGAPTPVVGGPYR